MREGENVAKEKKIIKPDTDHRIIIPIHIPHENDYYKEAWHVFVMCLNSILKTSYYKNTITVISDGCTSNVNERLFEFYKEDKIQELIIEKNNIGKINAILKALRTSNESYITIADADILFKNNWDIAVFKIYDHFPKAAVVSPIPLWRRQFSYTANIWVDYYFSNKLRFIPVENPEDMQRFAQSIGWDTLEPRFKDVILALEHDHKQAVLGATHCVATYKKSYLQDLPETNSAFQLGGQSEGDYLDNPPYRKDGYRLSTTNNYAYHLGNKIEAWQVDYYNAIDEIMEKKPINTISIHKPRKNFFKKILEKALLFLIKNRSFYNQLLLRKGLEKEKLNQFWY